jgi:hypothetical protein
MPKMGVEPGRGWHQVAGPSLTPSSFHAATVPDGDGHWADGEFERIESRNRKLLKEHFDKLTAAEQAEIARVPATSTAAVEVTTTKVETAALIATIPSDLSIPNFLRRTNAAVPATAADEPAPCNGAGSSHRVAFEEESNNVG